MEPATTDVRAPDDAEALRVELRALSAQRDELHRALWRHRNRRLWRLVIALREALRSPRRFVALPLTVVRILTGPTPAPKAPPRPPRSLRSPRAAGPTAEPPEVRLRRRFAAPPRPATTKDLRIAGILDTFSEASFAPDCHLDTRFRPDNWQDALEAWEPHLLLVESAWKGNGGAWEYQVGSYNYAGSTGLPHLRELTAWCQQRGIVTVFWNKEDPVHFDKFKAASKLFDVVLTTDQDRIDAYRALPGARATRFGALPFAAQPRLHNPHGAPADREPAPVFAGTYYRNRHEGRRMDLDVLLEAARPFGLVIFDRMGGVKNESTGFPDRFDPHVRGGLPYEEMVKAYRRYKVFLNTNSVTNSPTMFSRRVFELLACGTPVVSTPSVGMERMLGDVVHTVRTPEEARAALVRLLNDDDAWLRSSRAGIREIAAEHTYAHRLSAIAATAGLDLPPHGHEPPTVLVLDDGDLIIDQLAERVHRHLGSAPVLVGSTSRPDGPTRHPRIRVVHQAAHGSPDERYAELADLAVHEWVAVVDPSDEHIGTIPDLTVARTYAEAEAYGLPDAADVAVTDSYVRSLRAKPALLRRSFVTVWPTAVDTERRSEAFLARGGRAYAVAGASA